MRPAHILPALLLVSACAVPDNATRVSGGAIQIAFGDGQNCWQGRCVRYDQAHYAVSLPGRNLAPVPAGIDPTGGFVTPVEFDALFTLAARATGQGVGRR